MSNSGKIWDTREAYKQQRNNAWSRGDIGLASSGTSSNGTINKVQISTTGNAVGFGDVLTASTANGGTMSGGQTRALFAGGNQPSVSNVICYKEYSSDGNFADFGDLSVGRQILTGTGNATRGIFAGGRTGIGPTVPSNVIDTVSYASLGNATDFGDLTVARIGLSSMQSPTRGVFAGGGSPTNVIDFITFSSAGNATDFGDIGTTTSPLDYFGGVSSETRGVFAGGGDPSNASIIALITIASTSNSQDFGDLTQSRILMAGASNTVRGVFFGGQQNASGGPASNVIDFVTIATTGNATDFGDVSGASSQNSGGTSNGHGGIVLGELQRPSVNYMPGSGRGFNIGGSGPSQYSLIEMLNVATLGAISDFGNLAANTYHLYACANINRIVTSGSDGATVTMESIQTASAGNAADFGDATTARRSPGACSNTTRGVFAGGNNPGSPINNIDYVTIDTAGNATDFGDLTVARAYVAGGNSPTRGLFGGGDPSTNVIDYITIASTSNATDFGDLLASLYGVRAVSSTTRCVFMAGTTRTNVMQYVTIASTGNATDFGDLDAATTFGATSQNITRGCYMGGEISASPYNVSTVQYMTIASTGNTADWGDLKNNMQYQGGASDNHGGLQSS